MKNKRNEKEDSLSNMRTGVCLAEREKNVSAALPLKKIYIYEKGKGLKNIAETKCMKTDWNMETGRTESRPLVCFSEYRKKKKNWEFPQNKKIRKNKEKKRKEKLNDTKEDRHRKNLIAAISFFG